MRTNHTPLRCERRGGVALIFVRVSQKIKEGNFLWDANGALEPMPLRYSELLMGFAADYCKVSSASERQKQCGNAVVPAVIDYNCREQVATLPKDRRWVVLSLFNGIDGFPLGVMEAAESLWLIEELLKTQQQEIAAAVATASSGRQVAATAASVVNAENADGDDDSSDDDESDDDSRGRHRVAPLQKKVKRLQRRDLLGKCCADLRHLAEQHHVLPLPANPDPGQSPPWLPHGMVLVSVECCENARRVTRSQHRIRRQHYGEAWMLVDDVQEFCAKADVYRNGKVSIRRGQPDVATVSKLTVDELEAAIAKSVRKQSGGEGGEGDQVIEIDIICGGSPCVNLVGNAAYSGTIRSLDTLKDDDPSKLWYAQKRICHQLMKVYKLRDSGGDASSGATGCDGVGSNHRQEDVLSSQSSSQSSQGLSSQEELDAFSSQSSSQASSSQASYSSDRHGGGELTEDSESEQDS
jgi:hypothetical protein